MRPSALSARNIDILHCVVQSYIETGEPVASRTVAKRLRQELSSASIRNCMADLCDEGFLSQPHTSAGRVPTEKAFQSYVKALSRRPAVSGEISRLRSELGGVATLQARVERSSHLLTEMTRSIGIAAAIPGGSRLLDQVELVGLSENRVLMVVVTRDRVVHNRVVALAEPVSQEELQATRNYLNFNFSGWSLEAVQAEVERRLEQESAAYDAILRRLHVLYNLGLLDVNVPPEVHLEGAANLVGIELHLTREKMRDLFRALEQKKRILLLLDQFLEQPVGEIGIQVGLRDAHPSMSELSLIGITVRMPGGGSGKVAVLGPMRMNYERVISAVRHVSGALESLPS